MYNVSLLAEHADIEQFQESNLWSLAKYTEEVVIKKCPCCTEPVHKFVATLVLQRRSGMLINMYVSPAICISLMLPCIFLLPLGSTTKLILGKLQYSSNRKW